MVSTRAAKQIPISRRVGHVTHGDFVGQDQTPAEGRNEELTAEVVQKGHLAASRECRRAGPSTPDPSRPSERPCACPRDARERSTVRRSPMGPNPSNTARGNQSACGMRRTWGPAPVAREGFRGGSTRRAWLRRTAARNGGGRRRIRSPRIRRATQLPRFTGLVRSPGEVAVRKTDIGRVRRVRRTEPRPRGTRRWIPSLARGDRSAAPTPGSRRYRVRRAAASPGDWTE